MKLHRSHIILVLLIVFSSASVLGRNLVKRQPQATATGSFPAYCLAGHNVGRIAMSLSNNGTIGANYSASGSFDCFTGKRQPNLEYPKGSGNEYLFGAALWVGAVIGNDTLVSTGQDGWLGEEEFRPNDPLGAMRFRSTLDPASPSAIGAISEQDYIGMYDDTCTGPCLGLITGPGYFIPSPPLHIQITQRSFSWSVPLAEDFVLIEYTMKNIGDSNLAEAFLGLYVDGDVHDAGNTGTGARDDLSGFRREVNAAYMPANCPATDSLNIAYIIDGDGDFDNPPWNSVPHVTGVRMLDAVPGASTFSYNWWIGNGNPIFDFGPQAKATVRDFGTGGTGTPEGDRNKYHVLRNGEIDYDQILTGTITENDSIWMFPTPPIVQTLSRGLDSRYLLSTGPYNLTPGQEATITFAFVAGEYVHVDSNNWTVNLLDTYEPTQYLAGLDFTDFDLNATWAGWVYDNPGVDTDSDGYAGEFRLCDNDTFWYKGDGVPDLRADIPPEAPVFWVEPRPSALHIRWNGRAAEETRDVFSRRIDFEGYRAYLATDLSPASFSLIGSYDIEDFHRLVWNVTKSEYELTGPPQTIEEARCLYAPGGCGDLTWHPEDFTRGNPFASEGEIFYFLKVGPNAAAFGLETPFTKRFPAAPKPPTNWTADSVSVDLADVYLTNDRYFKYFEYEFTIENLIPGKEYWVSMTTFDNGSQIVGAAGNESPRSSNAQLGIPQVGSACCVGLTGNIDCDPGSIIDIADLTTLINHLFIDLQPLCCKGEGNIDGDTTGVVDIADLTSLIEHLFISLQPTAACQ